MGDTPQKPANKHDEAHPRSGYIGRAAKLVETTCLLPRPNQGFGSGIANWFRRTIYTEHPRNYLSDTDCAERHIRAEARQSGVAPQLSGTAEFEHIMRHAREFAKRDAAMCLVRNLEDKSELPGAHQQFYGYRGADGKCHETQDRNVAQQNRQRYPQQKR